jgi:heme exporter protein B
LFNIFLTILKKDLKDKLLSSKAWYTISFFFLCLLIFPIAFGKTQYLDLDIATSAIWISTLFANLIALDQMYKEDYNDGTLLYYTINSIPLGLVVYAKCLVHWLFSGLPIVIMAPLCSYIFSGANDNYYVLCISLLLGTPIFTLIGSPIAALMLGSSLGSPFLTFITLPFYLPVIIFGVLGTNQINNINAEFYLLSAILSIVIIFFPMITVKILKNVIN